MKRVAVVGGGISGLSAAFYLERLRRSGAPIEYKLFESSARLGGVIRTEHVDGCTIEAGPDSFLTSKPGQRNWRAMRESATGCCRQMIASARLTSSTTVDLLPMPDGLQMMVPTKIWPTATTPLLSASTKFQMLREFLAPPQPLAPDVDESVASFVRRHFGDEVVTKLASPLLAGIYGGDADALSARATLPNLIAREATHFSLVRGALSAMRKQAPQRTTPSSRHSAAACRNWWTPSRRESDPLRCD